MTARKTAVAKTADEPALGCNVRVNVTGRVVGASEFEDGGKSFLVEYERRGKVLREWFAFDKLEVA